ncbi:hypothetical protein PTSG_08487 [Salpingoeca rosetta]|uniref:Elongation of fatty acids protein n=1 Tax=Salpingoeca rosetta (strain ATCC 50818 / BSB-021) TaxID=946362 RepID=F2UJU3_SALR5|nr:uncharacterized protein PTSG_08487 [Salpingoeca rosetta]EGD77392.1 hypothetical protein PTSG_08487 [Salpingoeca rosetta]|eukprot:XP_004990736.1 hypothetical protein PTSG_08487 [Salpingoeca rosetta]
MEATIREVELAIISFFNPDIQTLDDVKTRHMPLTKIEEPTVLVFIYLAFIFIGSHIMKSVYGSQLPPKTEKKGFLMKAALLLYNVTQVVLCTYMCLSALYVAFVKNSYSWVGSPFDLNKLDMARILHIFYLSKVLDFLDTVFMVLRRKWNQISFLHVYHHASILMVYWVNVNTGYDGDIYFTVVLNSFIHAIMYSYYGLTAVGVTVPRNIKRLITHSQRIQFVLMIAQGVVSLAIDCPFPHRVLYMYLIYIASMLFLFTDFDRKTYAKKDDKKPKSS